MEKNINKIAYDISKLDSTETDKLIDVLVNKYGIFANIYPYPVGIISTALGTESQYDVYLKDAGHSKLRLVKRIKEMLDIGLKAAKDIIDSAPCVIVYNVSFDKADKFKTELEKCGATIEMM